MSARHGSAASWLAQRVAVMVRAKTTPHSAQGGAAQPEYEGHAGWRSPGALVRQQHFNAMYAPIGWHGFVERPNDVVRREHAHACYGQAAA